MDNIDKYRVFYEVAKAGNVTKASEKLFISQPAVSQTIKKLEEELSVTLFIRNKKGVTLTKIGEEVFQRVEGAMLTLKSIDKIVEEENELLRGNIVLGSGSNVARELLTLPIKNFLENFPNVEITQIEEVQSYMLDLLRKGQADIIITQKNDEIEDLPFSPIMKRPYVFVKAKNSKTQRFIKISKGSYAHLLFDSFIKKNKLQNSPTITVTGYRMAIELAKLGVGVALVPEFLVTELIENEELEVTYKDYKLPIVTFGYYHNPALITPATKVFLKFLE